MKHETKIHRKLYGDQGGYCNGCKEHFNPKGLTIDHIVPTSQDGTEDFENLQLLCNLCNSIKGDRSMEYLKKSVPRPLKGVSLTQAEYDALEYKDDDTLYLVTPPSS